jgi:hypothetical protein
MERFQLAPEQLPRVMIFVPGSHHVHAPLTPLVPHVYSVNISPLVSVQRNFTRTPLTYASFAGVCVFVCRAAACLRWAQRFSTPQQLHFCSGSDVRIARGGRGRVAHDGPQRAHGRRRRAGAAQARPRQRPASATRASDPRQRPAPATRASLELSKRASLEYNRSGLGSLSLLGYACGSCVRSIAPLDSRVNPNLYDRLNPNRVPESGHAAPAQHTRRSVSGLAAQSSRDTLRCAAVASAAERGRVERSAGGWPRAVCVAGRGRGPWPELRSVAKHLLV